MIMPCGLSIIKEVLSECPSVRVSKCPRVRVGEGESGRRGEWGRGKIFLLPTSLFLLPDIRYIRYIRYRIRCRTSFLIKLKSQSAIAKPKPKLPPNCKQPQSSPLRY